MSDVLVSANFPEGEFDKVKKNMLSGLASEKDDPNAILSKVARVMRFGSEHPYGEIETEETIGNVTLDDVKKYYVQNMKPNISYLIVVGDITPKEVDMVANKYFAKWMKGEVMTTMLKPVEMPTETTVDFVNKTGAVQSAISVTYPVMMAPGATDAIKASVMNTMFGGFFGSRLNENIREDKGYSYGVRASLRPDPIIGSFSAGGSVRNEVTDSTLTEFMIEMNRIRDTQLNDEEFNMVKSVMAGNFARRLESPETVARYALNIARYNLPADYYATYLTKLDAVTKEDIQAMAKKYIRPENAHLVVVGNKDEVAEKVARFAKSGQVNFYDFAGQPITDSGASIPDGVTAETIVADYLEAIGGKATLSKVMTLQSVMTASVQGMEMESKMYQQAPNKSAMTIGMNGQVMQKMVFDGEKGYMEAMGQKQDMPKPMADKYAISNIYSELEYATNKTKLELAGIETVEGKAAYKINVEFTNGQKQTDYYAQETSYKIRSIATEQGQTQVTDLSDFQEVDGIMIPHNVTITGAMPFPLEMKMQSVKVNGELDANMFKVD
jgi:zinc protease